MNALLLTLLIGTSPTAIGSLGAGSNVVQPAVAGEIAWVHGTLDEALADAKDLTMVYCWRDGSDYCAKLYTDTLGDADVIAALGGRPVVSANHGDAAGAALIERFHVSTLPAILFVDPEGTAQDVILGFIGSKGLIHELGRIGRGEGTLSDLRARAAAAEGQSGETYEERMALAGKLLDLGQAGAHDEILSSIRAADPKSKTLVGARANLWQLQADLYPKCECESEEVCTCTEPDPASFDLSAIYRHAKKAKLPEAKFEAYAELAGLESKRGEPSKAIANLVSADKVVPEAQSMQWRRKAAKWVLHMEGERTSKEHKVAIDLATAALVEAKELEPESDQFRLVADEYTGHEQLVADYRSTLAWALQAAGHQEKAEALMEMCVGHCPEGSFAEQLEEMKQLQ